MMSVFVAALLWQAAVAPDMAMAQIESRGFHYLPNELEVKESKIRSPHDFLGYEIGERHIRHHESVAYLQYLGQASDRVKVESYGKTHGNRPLLTATITSAKNHIQLDHLLAEHQKLVDPNLSRELDTEHMPAVIYMGYSVHGDESSGGNAVPIVAHMLAATTSKEIRQLLDEVIIVLDPCFNPDGFDRFAAWANSKRGLTLNADPAHAEHNQPFPGGRVNYYWFDLNRDWLPLQHPESQGRANVLRKFRPNVVLDFHEMGTNSSFFFQPGIPKRKNPLTPNRNVELTKQLGNYHAKALDEIGSIYFTEEQYDDFYMGKGSTYPDLHGAVGILFEQASSRGHVQESDNGLLEFKFTIRNQVRTSISSLRGTRALREQLLDYQRDFYTNAKFRGSNDKTKYHVFTSDGDASRITEFARILVAHNIETYTVSRPTSVGAVSIAPKYSVVVPTDQPEYLFLQSLLERRTDFEENIFYDISTWVLPLAFNLRHDEIHTDIAGLVPYKTPTKMKGHRLPAKDTYAFVVDWRDQRAGKVLYELLSAGAVAKVAKKPFDAVPVSSKSQLQSSFSEGAVLIPTGLQSNDALPQFLRILASASAEGISVTPVRTGLTPKGIDLGSSQFARILEPKVMLLAGDGVSRYAAGTVWHMLDTKLSMPASHVEPDRVSSTDLSRYTTIIMPPGSYSQLSSSGAERLEGWVRSGGSLIAIGSSIRWLVNQELLSKETIRTAHSDDDESQGSQKVLQRSYADSRSDRALELISGAIFDSFIDRTHPACYGYTTSSLPVFRNSTLMLEPSQDSYSNPVLYKPSPLLAGYVSQENLKRLGSSVGLTTVSMGSGNIILLADEPNFRAFWYGTSRLLTNSIFFGNQMRTTNRAEEAQEHGHAL